ncbi:MAG: ATP-binding protein, partial [Pseudomonadota bacterium]
WEGRRAAAAGPGGGYSEYVDQDGRAIACFDRIVGGGDLVGVRFDVTELRQKQRALEVAEAEIGETTAALRRETQRLRAISSFAPVGAWIYDFDEDRLTWDQATRAMFGVDDAFDPTPQAALRFLTPSAASELRRVAREATAEKRPFECLLEFKNAEGGRGWARIAGAPDADDAARFSGVVQDVTAEREQSEALRIANQELMDAIADLSHAEKRFFDIAAVSTDWFWETDREGRFVYISESFGRETGADPMKMIGRTRREMLSKHPESLGSADWDWLDGKTAARETFSDFVYRNFDAREADPVWVRISGAPHFDSDGAFAGYRGVGSNVTALYSALRKAEEASAAKTAFLATMSHEIRTPMNGVLGLAEELESRIDDAEGRALAASIRESGAHLLSVINDILDVSKIEAGELTLEEEPFDLDDLLRRIVAVHAARAEEKGLLLALAGDGEAGCWRGDAHRVMQIAHNLVSNAVKFTESGRVELSARPSAAGGLTIAVADTGIGMTAEQIDRAAEWFRQGDASTTRRFGGTGLGMTIVHDLAAAMGGRVEIESEPGRGTTISTFLPLPRAQSKDIAARPKTAAAASPPPGLSVLAVDDNATNRMLIELLLKRAEMKVSVAEDGAEAVAAAAERRFDVILMDIAMPGMDGTEALRRIRAAEAEEGRRTPALAVTANVLSHQVDEYLSLGFDGHVAKPIQREALLDGVRRALAAAAPRAAE